MNVLIWNSPWIAQGDILFYKNCFVKHLVPQANMLLSMGHNVSVVTHDLISDEAKKISAKAKIINLSLSDVIGMVGVLSDPSQALYADAQGEKTAAIQAGLEGRLADHYDLILLWETPVPFLEARYPEALIVHQMPGAFCRAPFPHMVTFDPVGLYKQGSLYRHFDEIVAAGNGYNVNSPASQFTSSVKDAIAQISPFSPQDFDPKGQYRNLALLPLQTSGHYAFLADTPYISQADYLVDVLSKTPSDTGLVVTQYVTPRVKDTVLSTDVLHALKQQWPNLIFDEKFDQINSISQYILPAVDQVISCSSSIALQSMIWNKEIAVPHDTFIRPLSADVLAEKGLERRHAYASVLDFIINRQQPLAQNILTNKPFFSALIEDMVARKKAGKTGLALFADFSDIDPDYHQKLHEQFNIGRAARDIDKANSTLSAQNADALKLDRIIKREGVEHITFDVFDTLIDRPVETPADAYKFLETMALQLSNGLTEDFYKVRLMAEVETRANSSAGEITLDEIYQAIAAHYQLDDALTDRIKQAEIELEIGLIQTRPAGKRLWDTAMRSGKPVSIISDMYLPAWVIGKMLEKAGYTGYQKLYVSSEYGVRKKEGGLFDVVLAELDLSPEKIIHIGDNAAADIAMPKARGMLSFRLLRALDRMRGNPYYKEIFHPRRGAGEKPRSIIAGLIAAKLFDMPAGAGAEETMFMGSPYNLGYAAIGPMLVGYMQWLTRQAQKEGLGRLYFLSREGWVLKQVYDALNKDNPQAVPSHYLYSSRRAVRVASIRNQNDILNVASQPYSDGVTVGQLLSYRFGLSAEHIDPAILSRFGYQHCDEKLGITSADKVRFSRLCQGLHAGILAQATRERSAYLRYLTEAGLMDEQKAGIVDIGWKANMQGSLGALLGKPLHGYYYATLQGAESWLAKGQHLSAYAGDFVTLENRSSAVNNRHLVEFLTCHIERSLVSMSVDPAGNLVRTYRDEPNHAMRAKLIDEVHNGAICFARDVAARFGALAQQAYIDWTLAEKVFSYFVNSPAELDARMMVGQSFEDAFGGISKKFVIGSHADQLSVWKRGEEVIYPKAAPAPVKAAAKKAAPKPRVITPPSHAKPQLSRQVPVPRFYTGLEKLTFTLFLSKRKYSKYLKDRDLFFTDTKVKMLSRWYDMTTRSE